MIGSRLKEKREGELRCPCTPPPTLRVDRMLIIIESKERESVFSPFQTNKLKATHPPPFNGGSGAVQSKIIIIKGYCMREGEKGRRRCFQSITDRETDDY
jgi:hypothetical protein